nr:hypothetical protein [Agrobacterium tomkonis]ASK47349.1 hypothetical protein [Agrobacterium tomkonis]
MCRGGAAAVARGLTDTSNAAVNKLHFDQLARSIASGLSVSKKESSMGDLETTIVIDPAIPLTDITELERLVLSSVFDAGEVDNALLLYTDSGAALTFSLAAGDLSVAYETSRRSPKSELNRIVAECWRDQIDGRDRIEIDLRPSSWEFILQDIVARSETLSEVRVLEWSRIHRRDPTVSLPASC